MVSSVCRGSYPTMQPQGSPSRKLHIDPAKDYSSPLNVETSVEYDLPEHIYPPKGAAPILMVHPGFVSTPVRVRSRAVITPSPTAMVATSGATRPLAPLQQQQGLTNSSSRAASRTSRSWCSCGNPNCNFNSAKSVSVQSVRNMQNIRNVQSIENIPNAQSVRSVSSRDVVVIDSRSRNSAVLLQKQQQNERNSTVIVVPHSHQNRNSAVLLRQPSSIIGSTATTSTPSTQQLIWGAGGRCTGPCCHPRPAAIAPPQAEFVAPGLPPSLLARTPTRGTAGGSPKLRAARSRRGMSVASTVNLPDYMTMSSSRSARAMGTTAHSRPRALSTSMGALVATPAPPMAHQQHMQASLTTSLDLARAHSLTPKSLFHAQQPPQFQSSTVGLTASMGPSLGSSMVSSISSASMGGSTSSLLSTVGLSRDSGCSTGGDHPLDWTSDRTRGLVDSGFCTPVDLTDDFIAETLSLPSWKESPTSSSSMGHTSSPLLPGTSHHHYLPQPLWNLVY